MDQPPLQNGLANGDSLAGSGDGSMQRHTRHRALWYHSHLRPTSHDGACESIFRGFFNPTKITFQDPSNKLKVNWNSREHRKGRFARVEKRKGQKLKRPYFKLWGFEFGNISWWVAQLFTWGSVAWVLNGEFLFFPGQGPSEKFDLYFTAYSALVGGTLFWFGAYFAVVEALNVGRQVRFGHEVRRDMEALEQEVLHLHPRGQKGHMAPQQEAGTSWRWWGWRWRDLGYVAAIVQFVGATMFQASVILGVPGVLPSEADTNYWTWDATFWSLQTVGAWGFIISSAIYMLETQKHWWLPNVFNLGWQIGFWNFVGAWGFEFSAIFGYWAAPAGKYQRWGSSFSTYWGAWAFLIGSYLQLLEVLNKHPTDSAPSSEGHDGVELQQAKSAN